MTRFRLELQRPLKCDVDIEPGRNAGVETWVVPTGSNDVATLQAAKAQRLFPGISDIVGEVLAVKP